MDTNEAPAPEQLPTIEVRIARAIDSLIEDVYKDALVANPPWEKARIAIEQGVVRAVNARDNEWLTGHPLAGIYPWDAVCGLEIISSPPTPQDARVRALMLKALRRFHDMPARPESPEVVALEVIESVLAEPIPWDAVCAEEK